MKVLFMTKYARLGPSSRYRVYQFIPWLQAHGVTATVSPLLQDSYIRRLYGSGNRLSVDLFAAALGRLATVARARRYDLVVIEKEIIPYTPPWLERCLHRAGAKMISDYDDAVYCYYESSSLSSKIPTTMALSRVVTVGNSHLFEYAKRFNANVKIVPTVVDLSRYPAVKHHRTTEPFVVGWIGSPATSKHVKDIAGALRSLRQECRFRLRCIGTEKDFKIPGVDLELVPWTENSEVNSLLACDVGIMPLPDDPFTRGKCGLKIIQYMACGLPVVASPVGANNELVEDGLNGYKASQPSEWVKTLHLLSKDPSLRNELGRQGRQMVEGRYSLQVTAPKLLETFHQALD